MILNEVDGMFIIVCILCILWGVYMTNEWRTFHDKWREIDRLFAQLDGVQMTLKERESRKSRKVKVRPHLRNPIPNLPLGSEFDQAWAKENGIKLDD